MAENESSQERTEEATPKRRREAREKGQIPRSRELNTMLVLLAAAGALLVIGDKVLDDLLGLFRKGLSFERVQVFDVSAMQDALMAAIRDALIALTPLMIVLVVVALLAPVALGGWSFSPKSMAPKLDKLNPIKGLGRVFGARGLMELVKAFAKFSVISVSAVFILWGLAADLLSLGNGYLHTDLARASELVGWSFLAMSTSLIFIVLIDVPFQLWEHHRQLKMTRQEVKDEYKETEGRPEVKARIRQLQREMAERRMMEEVPRADVVVTNPTHFAVALKYGRKMNAPKVVAKGADLIAANIRRVAAEHNVPTFEAPPLARALYHHTELNQEIDAGLYVAVAQVLAYVYQLRTRREAGEEPPARPGDLPIPEHLRDDDQSTP